jgi:hypothetical protein
MSTASPWTWFADVTIIPIYAIWLVGIVVALARWSSHPRVSAIIAASLASMLVLGVGLRFGTAMILNGTRGAGQSTASVGVYLGILALVASLLRAGAWAAVLIALFGWRDRSTVVAAPFQFSIRGLVVLTLAVALLCGLVRGLIYLLGESAAYLLNLIDDIPLILCWIVGIRVAVRRWRVHPEV